MWEVSYLDPYASPNQAWSCLDLYALRVYLDTNRETFDKIVHLRYGTGKKTSYMISREALEVMSPSQLAHMVPDILKEMLDHLSNQIKSAKR
jgi:hypothetical protein